MLKIKQTNLVLVIVITSTAIMAVATTTQILQPAYSQASHCREVFGTSTCVTPGQTPTINGIPIAGDNPHQEAGRQIHGCHSTAAQTGGLVGCTVTPP